MSGFTLTPAQCELAAELDPSELTDRVCEALRAEHGRWDEDLASEALALTLTILAQAVPADAGEGA